MQNNKDTEDLYITRKRKKWKFAHFQRYQNCFDLGHYVPRSDKSYDEKSLRESFKTAIKYLPKQQPLTVELAAGNAQFSLESARRNPTKNFMAIDIKADRLYTSAKAALEEGVNNIVFVRLQISLLKAFVAPHSVDVLWLTFPDPRPKKGDQKQRLTHPNFLLDYQEVLAPNGKLYFKTDNMKLFDWSTEQFRQQGWTPIETTRDLHASDLASEYKIMTHYEKKYHAKGDPIFFACLSPN